MLGARFKSIGSEKMDGALPIARAFSGEMLPALLSAICALDGMGCTVVGNPVGEIIFVRINEGRRAGELIQIDYAIAAHRFSFKMIRFA
jgi:hypothetical protein